MNRLLLLVGILLLFSTGLFAQVGIGILDPDTCAVLHLESTSRGLLLPRMNTTQRNAIVQPKAGLTIYNTADSVIQYYNGVCWLNVYQENCTDCHITTTMSPQADTIDRLLRDSSFTDITIHQIAGTPQNVTLSILGQTPVGVTTYFTANPVSSNGTTRLVFRVTPFTPAGSFPIIVQAFCGPSLRTMVFWLTILPCYELYVNNTTNNYSVSTDLYATYPTAPTNSPVCVVVYVRPGVNVGSSTTASSAMTTGSLPTGSIVGVVNDGSIIGKGGDGGTAYDPAQGWTGNGTDGGHALNLTAKTAILNNGYLFGGGGGGGSAAFQIGYTVTVLGQRFTIGFLVGSGGGGGAGSGLGGNVSALINRYSPGQNGTGGINGQPGQGGVLNNPFSVPGFPMSIGIGSINLIANPNTIGGSGGAYGLDGTTGSFNLTLSGTFTPIIGPTIGIGPFNIPIPVPMPTPGKGGNAVKRNGNNLNGIPDNLYFTNFLKGRVGN
ncbi:MAG: hypothetical protein LC115_09175 [Bacteroidia bacterium]|nr:hypothetical protein [Bacteroidia bacterium]